MPVLKKLGSKLNKSFKQLSARRLNMRKVSPSKASQEVAQEKIDSTTAALEIFRVFDHDKNGLLTFVEIVAIILRFEPAVDTYRLRRNFDAVDTNRSGTIDEAEFVKMMTSVRLDTWNVFKSCCKKMEERVGKEKRADDWLLNDESSPDALSAEHDQKMNTLAKLEGVTREQLQDWKKVFRAFDRDDSGEVSFAELSNIVLKNEPFSDILSLQREFEAVDTDNSGSIGLIEFVHIMASAEASNDAVFSLLARCAGRMTIQAKQQRLARWSILGDVQKNVLKNVQKRQAEEWEHRRLQNAVPKLVGTRSKLLWRTGKRLDFNCFEASDKQTLILQAFMREPAAVFDLLFLKKDPILFFLEERKSMSSTHHAAILDFITSRIQIADGKCIQLIKLAEDCDEDIVKGPISELNIPPVDMTRLLSSSEWKDHLGQVKNSIERANSLRRKSAGHEKGFQETLGKLTSPLSVQTADVDSRQSNGKFVLVSPM